MGSKLGQQLGIPACRASLGTGPSDHGTRQAPMARAGRLDPLRDVLRAEGEQDLQRAHGASDPAGAAAGNAGRAAALLPDGLGGRRRRVLLPVHGLGADAPAAGDRGGRREAGGGDRVADGNVVRALDDVLCDLPRGGILADDAGVADGDAAQAGRRGRASRGARAGRGRGTGRDAAHPGASGANPLRDGDVRGDLSGVLVPAILRAGVHGVVRAAARATSQEVEVGRGGARGVGAGRRTRDTSGRLPRA